MSVNPGDFLNHSQRLKGRFKGKEIARRCSISRGYYYAFHYVRENGRGHQEEDFCDGPGDHQEAVDFLEKKGEKKLSIELDELQTWRENADYELNHNIGKSALDDFHGALEQFDKKIKKVL